MWDFIQKCEILLFFVQNDVEHRLERKFDIIYNPHTTQRHCARHDDSWSAQMLKNAKVILCEILFKNVRFYSYFRRFWVAKYTIGDQKLVPCAHKYIFGALACVLDGKTKFHFFHVRFYSYSWSKFTYVRF